MLTYGLTHATKRSKGEQGQSEHNEGGWRECFVLDAFEHHALHWRRLGRRRQVGGRLCPGGAGGGCEQTEASTGHGAGLLASTTRPITTEYAGTERVNRETWRIDYQPRTP